MKYLIKVPFATLKRSYGEGNVVEDVDDVDNLVAAGYVSPVEAEPVEEKPANPVQTKRGAK